MRRSVIILLFGMASIPALAAEPDGLTLRPGFHASVVADSLGPIRHLAVRGNGDIYVSTPVDKVNKGAGIIALRLDANHKARQVRHFSTVDGGTGIRFYRGELYASSPTSVYRFRFNGDELIPTTQPEVIVDDMPAAHLGFQRVNRPIAFDAKGDLYVALDGSGNLCTSQSYPVGSPPVGTNLVGLKPCPDLGKRAGVWEYKADKTNQKFPADGVQLATGIRDIDTLGWSPADKNLYGIMHGRDDSQKLWPAIFSEETGEQVADEMHRITKGTNFGWPYTYYDGVRHIRLVAPEYGGNGKTVAPAGIYSTPVLTFQSPREAPMDIAFYTGDAFPKAYHDGAFIVLHGTRGKGGSVIFVPFNRSGKAGVPQTFAEGFAGYDDQTASTPGRRAKYRPSSVAVGPDGALYIADSQMGRIWRIAYSEPSKRKVAAKDGSKGAHP